MFTVVDANAASVGPVYLDFLSACDAQAVVKDSHIEVSMQYEPAIAFLKALRGYTWFVGVERFAPAIIEANKGFRLHGNVRTTRKEALRVLDSMYGSRLKAERLVRFNVYDATVFV